ncbi:MAG: RluA family pseudouridine synthase [Streptococcaceae bacterium]|jgi:23S rRNA pseudouridine1911/1915/1917 synthase|nr:RluA family pseudouridine synthase [Streptococcaceae bacterium]
MRFSFVNDFEGRMVKRLLALHGVSKGLLATVKFDGGEILVNGEPQNAIYRLSVGDEVTILVPDERANPELLAEQMPLEIVYEDEDYLVVEKPAGIPSITGREKPTGSMSNYVAGYVQARREANQTVHIITRLDRDTSGLMLFAKHRYAHALLNNGPAKSTLSKRYFALVKFDKAFPASGEIDFPIGRDETSLVKRRVRFDGLFETKEAHTSYETLLVKNDLRLLDVSLHTGRTHQIRVHFAHLGYPLIGDDLYGGGHDLLPRQALHCHAVKFDNPIRGTHISLESPLPHEMAALLS